MNDPFREDAAGPESERAVQVVSGTEEWSGYVVETGLVLTAAGELKSSQAEIRFLPGREGEYTAVAETIWIDHRIGVALLRLVPEASARASAVPRPIGYGRLEGRASCEALGYPRFKTRRRRTVPGETTDETSGDFRDSRQAVGFADPVTGRRSGVLEMYVEAPGSDPDAVSSPWEGMAGAAVWCEGRLIGLVMKHHPDEPAGTLRVTHVDHWYADVDPARLAELTAFIGLPAQRDELLPVGAADPAPAVPRPRQLPPATTAFAGRRENVRSLITALGDTARDTPGRPTVCVIDGMAGAGKTALAVHVAHAVAAHYPDGQLFLELRGFSADAQPLTASTALFRLLRSMGVGPQQISDEYDKMLSDYHGLLRDRRVLLVLDDAATSRQVLPLIPAASGCAVIVTSRRRLGRLRSAVSVSLSGMPPDDAAELFHTVSGPGRIPPGHLLLPKILEYCGYLPLAIRIIAARLRHHPLLEPEDIVDQLQHERTRLDFLADDERELAAVFAVSYAHLPEPVRHVFRALGISPGSDFDVPAAAVLADVDEDAAERSLEVLVDDNLLACWRPGRYRFHDLVRAYARSLSDDREPDERPAVFGRLFDHYLRGADAADQVLRRYTKPGREAAPVPATGSTPVDGRLAALNSMRADRDNIFAVLSHAPGLVPGSKITAMSAALAAFLEIDGPSSLAADMHRSAAAHAAEEGDAWAEAAAWFNLGRIQYVTGDYVSAISTQTRASEIYRSLDCRPGIANTEYEIARSWYMTDQYEQAIRLLESARGVFGEVGDRLGEANALNELAEIRFFEEDDYRAALELHEQALASYEDLGDRLGQADVLRGLGRARLLTRDVAGALECPERALLIYRELGHRQGEAEALTELGNLILVTGNLATAAALHREAVMLFESLGHRQGLADASWYYAVASRATGDLERAAEAGRRALEEYKAIGDRRGEAYALGELMRIARLQADPARARELQKQSLALCTELGSRQGIANAVHELGLLDLESGEFERAASSFDRAMAVFEEVDDDQGQAELYNSRGSLLRQTGRIVEARESFLEALRLARRISSPVDEARALEGVGRCAADAGDLRTAGSYLQQAVEIFERVESADAPRAIEALARVRERGIADGQRRE